MGIPRWLLTSLKAVRFPTGNNANFKGIYISGPKTPYESNEFQQEVPVLSVEETESKFCLYLH
jgi:hypothetical protein